MRPDEDEVRTGAKAGGDVLEGILNGDLPGASSIALIGAPGTGTSIMATQYIVNALIRGKKVVFALLDYVPQLAEKYFKLFGFNARPFMANGKLQIVDGYELLRTKMGISTMTDIENLRPLAFEEISEVFQRGFMSKILENEDDPSSVVLDSLTSLSPFVDVHTLYGTLAEGFARMKIGKHPSLVVAHEGVLESNFVQTLTRFVDGIIRLKMEWSGRGLTRVLYIEKMRLTNVQSPTIDFTINDRGVTLDYESVQARTRAQRDLPRVEADQATPSKASKDERTSTGIPGLDTMLGGGFPRGTFICVEGDVGTGTSTFCAQFAWTRLMSGGRVAYYCVDEPPETVIKQFQSYGWNLAPYMERKSIIFSDAYGLFMKERRASLTGAKEPNAIRKLLGDFMKEEYAKFGDNPSPGEPLVAVIDSFTTLTPYLDLKTAYVLARIVADNARAEDQTYLTVVRSGAVEANLLYACLGTADGIVALENIWPRGRPGASGNRRLVRRMRIDKMAFTSTPANSIEYEITPKGIQLVSTNQS